jgi:hypothetical protein
MAGPGPKGRTVAIGRQQALAVNPPSLVDIKVTGLHSLARLKLAMVTDEVP